MTPLSIPDDQVDEVVRLIGFGFTDVGIGHRYDCTKQTVINFRKRHGIARKRGGYRPRRGQPALLPPLIGDEPIRIYHDKNLNHPVRVFAARYVGMEYNTNLPYMEEIECIGPIMVK